jgi:CubicO group peptidase (beta-lactamase class C family)
VKIRVSGGVFLATVIIACVGWLAFYAHGAVAREANKYMVGQVERGFFSGTVLISRDGQVLFEHAYGMANAEEKIPNTLDTRFRIGSISKTITAIMVMQLEGEHRLALTDPICKYLDECPPGWSDITLHHLLSHTSGIFNYTQARAGDMERFEQMWTRPRVAGEDFARFLHEPLAFAPGARFEYSNSNYRLLAHVIEEVTRQSYEEALRRRIFEPAGMQDSGLTHEWPATAHAAVGYWMNPQGKTERAPMVDGTWSSGDGGIYSTVLDLQKLSDALDHDKLIPRATLERMRAPVTDVYGYGWSIPVVSKLTLNRKQVSHGGSVPGFLSQFQRYEDEKVTVIALSNKMAFPLTQVAQALGAAVFGEPFSPSYERETVEVPQEVLKRYEGDYELEGRVWTLLVRDGRLYVRPKDDDSGPGIALLAASENVFFMKGADGDVTVAQDAAGDPKGLALNIGDRTLFAKKVR